MPSALAFLGLVATVVGGPGGDRSAAAAPGVEPSTTTPSTTTPPTPPPSAAPEPLVELTGTLVEVHADYVASGTAHLHSFQVLQADGTMVPLDQVPDATAHSLVDQTVRVWGRAEGGELDLGSGGLVAATGATGTGGTGVPGAGPAAMAPGVKTVAVVLVNFTGDTRQPWTPAQARAVVFDGATSVNAYYQDASDGQVSLTGDVFGYVTITKDNVGCDWSQWGADARAAALAAGAPLANYTYTVYAWPRTVLCGWAGLAYLPGTSSYIDGYLDTRVVGHELGHNFGVHHASTLACTANGVATVLTGTCTADEYGDPFSIMGNSTRLHNNWHRQQLGWSMGTVTATASGSFTLAPADAGAGTRLVRVPRGDGTYLNLEYRRPSGLFDNFALSAPAVGGVSVRVAPEVNSTVQSKLIDASPTTPSSFNDPVMRPGMTLTDPLSKATITVASVSGAGAQVTVSYGRDTVAPSVPTGLTAAASSTATTASATVSWTAATDNVGVTGYRVRRGSLVVGTTTGTTFTDPGLVPGTTYSFRVEAYDAAGNTSRRASVSVTTADITAPSVPTNFRATIDKNGNVKLTWTAATDNVGVAGYTLTRASRTWKATGTSTTERPGLGTWTWTIVARDAAGNRSAPTTVTATTTK